MGVGGGDGGGSGGGGWGEAADEDFTLAMSLQRLLKLNLSG